MKSPGGEGIRAFLALALEPELRDRLASRIDDMRGEPWSRSVRWVRPQNLHLTLRFLGDVPADSLQRLEARLEPVVSRVPAFDLEICGLELSPSVKRPRLVVAHTAESRDLHLLAARIEDAVVAQGLPAERRPFWPHITLGRVRRRIAGAPKLDASPVGAGARIEWVTLYRSRLEPTGAVYSELARLRLRG